MKKIYMSALALTIGLFAGAQTTSFESADGFTAGATINGQSGWQMSAQSATALISPVPQGIQDLAGINTDEVSDGTQSLKLAKDDAGALAAEGAVAFAALTPITVPASGVYDFSFDVFLAKDGDGSGQTQLSFRNDQTIVGGFLITYDSNGDPAIGAMDPDAPTAGVSIYGVPDNTWITCKIVMDIDNNTAEYFISGNSVANFNLAAAPNVMSLFNFGGTDTYYFDNFKLEAADPDLPNVSNVVATDISDNGDGTDLKVTFTVPDESNTEEYYLAVFTSDVDFSSIPNPGTNLPLGGAVIVTPNGSDVVHVFTAADKYSDGTLNPPAAIEEDVEYIVYVYSKAKSGFADVVAQSNKITLISTVSLTENTLEANVFPNPATNVVNFNVDGVENGTVAISSVTGQEVINTSLNGSTKVDVSNLNNGLYIYTIRNQEGAIVKTSKLVIK